VLSVRTSGLPVHRIGKPAPRNRSADAGFNDREDDRASLVVHGLPARRDAARELSPNPMEAVRQTNVPAFTLPYVAFSVETSRIALLGDQAVQSAQQPIYVAQSLRYSVLFRMRWTN
jgi:hypothetical protein